MYLAVGHLGVEKVVISSIGKDSCMYILHFVFLTDIVFLGRPRNINKAILVSVRPQESFPDLNEIRLEVDE